MRCKSWCVSVGLKNTLVCSVQLPCWSMCLYTWVSRNSIMCERTVKVTLMPGMSVLRKVWYSKSFARVPGHTPKISSRKRE